jgi:Uma2 family endonuclease
MTATATRLLKVCCIYRLSTAPSFFHQWIIRQIFLTLYAHIDATGKGLTIWSPRGVFMPGCDPVQPDLLVIRKERLGIIRDRRVEGAPDLLVEIPSKGNPEMDTDMKCKA